MIANPGDARAAGASEPHAAAPSGASRPAGHAAPEPSPYPVAGADAGPQPVGPPPEDGPPSTASRIVSFVLALVVGAVYGAVGTVAHPLTVALGPVSLPHGLVLALVGVLALFVGFRLVLGERLAVVGAAVGVIGVVSLFSFESTGGSVLIPDGVPGMVWLLGPALLGALVISWPSLPARAPRLDGPDAKESPAP